jgi:hypothetical protein
VLVVDEKLFSNADGWSENVSLADLLLIDLINGVPLKSRNYLVRLHGDGEREQRRDLGEK